jgi:hypothetical protein
MMVRIRYKTGTVRNVPAYVGKRLVERRIADYEPEDTPVAEATAPLEPEVDLDALTRDELYDLAVERGLDPHPQLGATKLKALLQ